MGSNSEIQRYNMYPMLHFCRKFSSSIITSKERLVVLEIKEGHSEKIEI